MDLDIGEQLNNEVDEVENLLANDVTQSKDCVKNDVNDASNLSSSSDQYLQIDFSEDENLTCDETLTENANTAAENVEGENDKNEKPNQENISSGEKESNKSKNFSYDGKKTKRKRRLKPFHRRPRFQKKVGRALSFPWLPEYTFPHGQNLLSSKRQFPCPNQMLNLNNLNQNLVLTQLMNNSRSNLPPSLAGLPFNIAFPNYQLANGKMLMPGNVGYQNLKPDFFVERNGIRDSGIFDENENLNDLISNFQTNDGRTSGLTYGAFNGTATCDSGTTFNGQKVNNYGRNGGEKFIKCLEEDEKKAIMLRKEARLRRFGHNDTVTNAQITNPGFEETPPDCSARGKVKFIRQNEENIRVDGEQLENSQIGHDCDPLPRKCGINKESLLKKINPFDSTVGTSNYISQIKPTNKEVESIKEVNDDTKPCISVTTDKQLPETEGKTPTPGPKTGPPVKFVRTISKSFEELIWGKAKTTPGKSGDGNSFPVTGTTGIDLGQNILLKQERQLTGCIVKVFNISPSTTTNDILELCSSIGIVMEIKLNFPRENSVVIRFAEPKCAEKFFSLYHGQKMNNYFLNVIIV